MIRSGQFSKQFCLNFVTVCSYFLTAFVLSAFSLGTAFGEEGLGEDEILWAGLAGNPPKYFDTGESKGLGYLEFQTKIIRKALIQAGFKLRYEYFSSARVSHEFRRHQPICFYPSEWSNPKKVFSTPPDQIYSIGLTFSGDESRTILVRKADEEKFKKFLDERGRLRLRELLNDRAFKTLLPKSGHLGSEMNSVYRIASDGSIEIHEPYRGHIFTRVMRDNNQLVQMLEGGSIDYLFKDFVVSEDFKAIRSRQAPFSEYAYESHQIKSALDPQLTIHSVICGIHPTTMKAMPVINSVIRSLRGAAWELKSAKFQNQFELDSGSTYYFATGLSYQIPDLASGKADWWLPLQSKYFPDLKAFEDLKKTSTGASMDFPPVEPAAPASKPKGSWIAVFPKKGSVFILPKADALELGASRPAGYLFEQSWLSARFCLEHPRKPWEASQLELLQTLSRSSFSGALTGSFEDVMREVQKKVAGDPLYDLSILARGLDAKQMREFSQTLKIQERSDLRILHVVSASASSLRELFPVIPPTIEDVSLFGSDLGELKLSPLLQKMNSLKKINLSCVSMGSEDYFESLSGLPGEMVSIEAGGNAGLPWTSESAIRFGKKSFPKLEVLNLEGAWLDDRQCPLFQVVPEGIRELKLNGNPITSYCLKEIFKKPLSRLLTLQLATARFSLKENFVLKLPPSVTSLDLSFTLIPKILVHLELPKHLKSLWLNGSVLEKGDFQKLALSLSSHLEVLSLSFSHGLDFGLLRDLINARVSEIDDLRLEDVDLNSVAATAVSPQQIGEIWRRLRVKWLDLTNTRLSNSSLNEIGVRLGPSLRGIRLGQNFISTPTLVSFLERAPNLELLSIGDMTDLEANALARVIPSSIATLDLSNNGLTDQDLAVLVSRLSRSLRRLDLSGSLFGVRGARVLAKAFQGGLQDLEGLNLMTSLSEEGWEILAPKLPSDLKYLALGPASLGSDASRHLVQSLPRGLDFLYFESAALNFNFLSDFTNQLPRGLRRIDFRGSSTVRELRTSKLTDSEARWPELLKNLVVYTNEVSGQVLREMAQALPHSNCNVWIRNRNGTASLLSQILQKVGDRGPGVEVNGDPIRVDGRSLASATQLRHFAVSSKRWTNDQSLTTSLKHLQFIVVDHSGLNRDIVDLFKQLPENMSRIALRSLRVSDNDVEDLIRVMPKGLALLNLFSIDVSARGWEKLVNYGKKIEKETGVPLKITR